MKKGYRTEYHYKSDIAHSGIGSEASYMHFVDSSPENTMNALRQIEMDEEIGPTCNTMLWILIVIEEGLGLMIYELIHDLYNQYDSYARAIEKQRSLIYNRSQL